MRESLRVQIMLENREDLIRDKDPPLGHHSNNPFPSRDPRALCQRTLDVRNDQRDRARAHAISRAGLVREVKKEAAVYRHPALCIFLQRLLWLRRH